MDSERQGDYTAVLVEKEILHSQYRKLEEENSNIKLENKRLKDKLNHAESRIKELEKQLFSDKESHHIQLVSLQNELAAAKRQAQLVAQQRKQQDIRDLTREFEEKSKIINNYKTQANTIKEELVKVKLLLDRCEAERQGEVDRRKEVAAQVVKLTEVKGLLQQQLQELGAGSVSDRQVKSLECRLRITEDRLCQERADRAAKLSETEEKLINENARLQVSTKELKRQLQRERDRYRNMEGKYKEVRNESERLNLLLADRPITATSDITYQNKLQSIRSGLSSKKHNEEIKLILDQIKQEENLGQGQENEIIWLLWQQRAEICKQVKEFELLLTDNKGFSGGVSEGLKNIQDERRMYEDRITRYKDTLEDITQERENLEQTLSNQVHELLGEKHSVVAKLKNLEDLEAAIKAENESLKKQLNSIKPAKTANNMASTYQVQAEQLSSELTTLMADLGQLERQNQLLNGELETLRGQDRAKDQALEEALQELETIMTSNLYGFDPLLIQRKRPGGMFGTSKSTGPLPDSNTLPKISKMTAELDDLQMQLLQKTRSFDHVSSEKNNSEIALGAFGENLKAANTELNQVSTRLRMKQLDLDHEIVRSEKLEADVKLRDQMLSQGIAQAVKEGKLGSVLFMDADTPLEVLMEADNRVRNLETEKDNLKHQVKTLKDGINKTLQENNELVGIVREAKQDQVVERAQLSQAVAEKVGIEQQLQVILEERNNYQKAKERLNGDIARYETQASVAIDNMRSEILRPHVNYEQKYQHLGAEGHEIATELESARTVMEAREKEIETLLNRIRGEQDDRSSSTRKADILKMENKENHSTIEKLTAELTNKLKENAALLEKSQLMKSEQTKLNLEKYQIEKNIDVEKSEIERKAVEGSDLKRKLEKTQDKLEQAEQDRHMKETQVVALQMELRHTNKEMASLANERAQLQTDVDKLLDEIRSLSNINSLLDSMLINEKSTLKMEKSSKGHIEETLADASRRIGLFKKEYNIMVTNLEAQKDAVQTIKEKCQSEEEKVFRLDERMKSCELENQTLQAHLNDTKATVDQYKKDKQTLYTDLQELYQKLSDKDELISRLQRKCDETVSSIQQDFVSEKEYYSKSREGLEDNLIRARDEIDTLNSKLRTKEIELVTYAKTQDDLEHERKEKIVKEKENHRLQTDLNEARRQVNVLSTEKNTLVDQCKQIQETLEKVRTTNSTLKDELRTQKESLMSEIHTMKHNMSDEGHKKDMAASNLNDKLNKTITQLKATEVSLQAIQETNYSLSVSNKTLEKTVESLKAQLHEETTGRKLGEQRIESLKSQLDDVREKRTGFDERVAELQATIARLETEKALERDKLTRLKQEQQDLLNTSHANDAHAQVLQMQVSELETENTSLKNQVETLKQGIQGKSKKTQLELKQQSEVFEQEKEKLLSQIEQLSKDLDKARDQVASKNRDNLKVQEGTLTIEEKLRDASAKLKQLQESLKAEEELRMKVDMRNQDLELALTRIKGRRGSDDILSDTSDVSKVMADMSKRMQDHLETQRNVDRDAKVKDLARLDEYKKKIATLESSLNQEKSLHLVTKTQLSAMEDDNHRLRQQLAAAKRRANIQSSEERTKSRMDEINEIIARSQTRAQQMLASGAYTDDHLRVLANSRDFSAALTTLPLGRGSPARSFDMDRSFQSDDLGASFDGGTTAGHVRFSPTGSSKDK